MNYARPEILTSAKDVAEILEDPLLILVDATVFLKRGKNRMQAESGLEAYKHGHIPGARFLDLIIEASDTSSNLGFTLPNPTALESTFQNIGVNNDSRVVFYSTGHMMWATRAWWLLHYLGHDQSAVLNGGFDEWVANQLPISKQAPKMVRGNFIASPRPNAFVSKNQVVAAMNTPETVIVNALTKELHTGESEFHYGRSGHITGSCNLPYDEMLENGFFRSASELESSLQKQNMRDANQVITYCGGGIAATIDAFACMLLGQDDIAVYDGSLAEWASAPELPMTTKSDA